LSPHLSQFNFLLKAFPHSSQKYVPVLRNECHILTDMDLPHIAQGMFTQYKLRIIFLNKFFIEYFPLLFF